MIWTQLWFGHHQKQWENRMEVSRTSSQLGHHAYAAKQARIWSEFWEHANREFGNVEEIGS
jgi:hypothetical protein